jgi:hypothetical protein
MQQSADHSLVVGAIALGSGGCLQAVIQAADLVGRVAIHGFKPANNSSRLLLYFSPLVLKHQIVVLSGGMFHGDKINLI